MTEKILLDTDIGSDIDDAVCLAYLLARPDCELLGVTTVSGQPVRRAMLASALCRVAGVAVAGWPHETDLPVGGAVDFLAGAIRAHPGEVTLLAIGPLTNVALLLDRHPDVAGLLKALVLMGGRYTTEGKPEWNIRRDPEAAASVFAAPVAGVRAVGLDVTAGCTWTRGSSVPAAPPRCCGRCATSPPC